MRLFYDGMHVNDESSRIYAEHIADSLQGVAVEIAARGSAERSRVATSGSPADSSGAR
jgi:hypothetical protein